MLCNYKYAQNEDDETCCAPWGSANSALPYSFAPKALLLNLAFQQILAQLGLAASHLSAVAHKMVDAPLKAA